MRFIAITHFSAFSLFLPFVRTRLKQASTFFFRYRARHEFFPLRFSALSWKSLLDHVISEFTRKSRYLHYGADSFTVHLSRYSLQMIRVSSNVNLFPHPPSSPSCHSKFSDNIARISRSSFVSTLRTFIFLLPLDIWQRRLPYALDVKQWCQFWFTWKIENKMTSLKKTMLTFIAENSAHIQFKNPT